MSGRFVRVLIRFDRALVPTGVGFDQCIELLQVDAGSRGRACQVIPFIPALDPS